MQHVAAFIIRHRIIVLILAVLITAPALYGLRHLQVEYDLLTYLPQNSDSVRGLNVLNREFGFSSSANVVVKNCPEWKTQQLKEKIQRIEGVSGAFWLSDLADPSVPIEYQRQIASQFYRGDATLIQVMFSQGGSSPVTQEAIKRIRGLLTEGQELVGVVVTTSEIQDQSQKEKPRMLLASLLILTAFLFLTLPSFVTPVLFLATLGASVAWNLGISYFLGQRVSYLTNSVAAALQLGVTMDYCIFLLHRFEEESARRADDEEAMIYAVKSTMVAILASSLTTVAGFATLGLMRVRIGADLGLTMARGVLIALLSTVTILPALIMTFLPLVKRFRHRSLLPSFHLLGKSVARVCVPICLLIIVIAVPAYIGQRRLNVSYDLERSFPESLPSMKALREMRQKYSIADSANIVTSDAPGWKNMQLDGMISSINGVQGTSSYYGAVGAGVPGQFVPDSVRSRYLSGDYYNLYVTLEKPASDPVSRRAFDKIRDALKNFGQKAYLTGQSVIDYDLQTLSQADTKLIDKLTLLAIVLIVAVSFKSLSIPLLLVLVIEVAIWFNQALVCFRGGTLYFFSALALSTIQLGSTVDYAILMTSRFREERAHLPAREAIARAVSESTGAIWTSGLTLFGATMGIYLTSSLTLVKDLSMLLARGAIISAIAASVFLPAALVVLDRFISATTIQWLPSRQTERERKEEA